jgi:hypothetical protein
VEGRPADSPTRPPIGLLGGTGANLPAGEGSRERGALEALPNELFGVGGTCRTGGARADARRRSPFSAGTLGTGPPAREALTERNSRRQRKAMIGSEIQTAELRADVRSRTAKLMPSRVQQLTPGSGCDTAVSTSMCSPPCTHAAKRSSSSDRHSWVTFWLV